MSRQTYRSEYGFSMIEVMVVLVIMGIVMAAAVPNVGRYMKHDQVRMTAENFRGACQVAQQRAMATRQRHRITYTPGDASWYLERRDADEWTFVSADTHRTPNGVDMSGGTDATDATILTFEPLGTIVNDDVPATIRFHNAHLDTSEIRVVRTGRMLVRHR